MPAGPPPHCNSNCMTGNLDLALTPHFTAVRQAFHSRQTAAMKKEDVDYSLYLVTDSTPDILGDRDIVDVVEQALRGGVTCVQYRDKTSDTAVLVSTARRLHEVTTRYKVPLLINDRVDVALAVGCEGIHIGQDDMGKLTYSSV